MTYVLEIVLAITSLLLIVLILLHRGKGGGLSNLAHLYAAVPARWRDFVFSDTVTTPLLRAAHGDSSGVLGAARLWDGG